MDGWIRMWFYDTIDRADPPDENRISEVEPVYEFHVSAKGKYDTVEDATLMCIQKKAPDSPENTFWYAQVSKLLEYYASLSTKYCTK